ncbi:hypothetical protein N0V94_006893 [Neodidymelliopsis sp. IMI 364377]|nr:hypothetical protein N0V94_006893 [Neodidymelliopsis sp. IMI 364377]
MATPHTDVSFEEYVNYLVKAAGTDANRLVQSDLFTFYVGKEEKPFVAHSQAIAATSEYFLSLVNGAWSESRSRTAVTPNTDQGTIVRFLEYAYRRDYTVPSWTLDEEAPVVEEPMPVPVPESEPEPEYPEAVSQSVAVAEEAEPILIEDEIAVSSVPAAAEWRWGSQWKTRKAGQTTKKKKKDKMQQMFAERRYLSEKDQPIRDLMKNFEPQSNDSAKQDFTLVFIAHAQLYTFADMHLVRPLKQLALHKLHTTLAKFSLYQERLGDVLELARYAYEHGEDRSEGGRIDELRRLVVEFIACEPKAFGRHKEFKRLMDEEGEFAGDLWDVVSKELL